MTSLLRRADVQRLDTRVAFACRSGPAVIRGKILYVYMFRGHSPRDPCVFNFNNAIFYRKKTEKGKKTPGNGVTPRRAGAGCVRVRPPGRRARALGRNQRHRGPRDKASV